MTARPTARELALDAIDEMFKAEITLHAKNAQVDRSIRLDDRFATAHTAWFTARDLALKIFP
jgi:hypothetical protein